VEEEGQEGGREPVLREQVHAVLGEDGDRGAVHVPVQQDLLRQAPALGGSRLRLRLPARWNPRPAPRQDLSFSKPSLDNAEGVDAVPTSLVASKFYLDRRWSCFRSSDVLIFFLMHYYELFWPAAIVDTALTKLQNSSPLLSDFPGRFAEAARVKKWGGCCCCACPVTDSGPLAHIIAIGASQKWAENTDFPPRLRDQLTRRTAGSVSVYTSGSRLSHQSSLPGVLVCTGNQQFFVIDICPLTLHQHARCI
jgi:hypothetical protein